MTSLSYFEENQFKEVLLHYKRFYLSLVIIICCGLLLFYIIIPQFRQYSDLTAQVEEAENRVTTIKKNISFIAAVDDQKQNVALQTSLRALPQDKDYAGILYAVKSASTKTGVGIGDFVFSVGQLSQKSVIKKGLPSVSIRLNVIGSPSQVSNFLTEISQTLPISSITDVALNTKSAIVAVEFYYKPIAQLRVNYSQPIPSLTLANTKLLDELSKWESSQEIYDTNFLQENAASASADSSPFAQ